MFLKPSSTHLRSVVSSGSASSPGVFVRRVWSLMAASPSIGGRRACPRCSRWSCGMRNGSVPPCLPHTSRDVYTDLKTQTLIMIRAKYSILKISTLCFCRVFNVHWNSLQMQLLSKLRENCTLFCWELYQELFTISAMPLWYASCYYSTPVSVFICSHGMQASNRGNWGFKARDLEPNAF